jgi:hypothetical protein
MTPTSRTPQEVFAHHGTALAAGDLDEIVVDYAEDSVLLSPAGAARGKDAIRTVFATLLADLPDAQWDWSGPPTRTSTGLTTVLTPSCSATARSGRRPSDTRRTRRAEKWIT